MTVSDLKRIYEEQAQSERNEAADAKRLSRARRELKRRMDEVEMENEETYE